MLRAKYLASNRFHAVDCEVRGDRLEAGWVYTDGYLQPIETLTDELGMNIAIDIPEHVQALKQPAIFSFADEPVEFYLANATPQPG